MIRVAPSRLAASFGAMVACGSTGGPALSNRPGGSAGGGGSGVDGSTYNLQLDGGKAGFSVAIEDSAQGVVTTATLNCAGDCVDVQAVAQGGVQPYTYTSRRSRSRSRTPG
jgi:hypothetical protein